MTERLRLQKLFEDHYDGSPWLDVNIVDTLSDVTAIEASTNFNNLNSIWQITKHMMEWRKANMQRASGIILHAPSHNFIYELKDKSEKAWNILKQEFHHVHLEFIEFIKQYDSINFDKLYEPNQHTYYEHIQGILQHDAYHLGQIVILKKLVKGK